jgi:hypothetical protein
VAPKDKTPSHLTGRPSKSYAQMQAEQAEQAAENKTTGSASQEAVDAVNSGQNPDGTTNRVVPDRGTSGTWDYSNQRYVDTLWDESPDGANSRLNTKGYFGTSNITPQDVRSDRQDVWDGYGYYSLSDEQKELVRNATYSHYGGREVDPSYFDKILDTALARSAFSIDTDEPITVEDALRGMLDPEALANGGGGGGGGGRSAPQAPDATSIRRVMDATSNNLIGRTLSDKEFDKYYKQYVGEFNANPDMDTQQVLTERVRKEKDYQEASVAGKFSQALASVMKGAI